MLYCGQILRLFLCIPTPPTDAAAVNSGGIKTL